MGLDENDWTFVENSKQRSRMYRCFCDHCGCDRGYQEKRATDRPCRMCRYLLVDREKMAAGGKKNKGRKHTPDAIDKIRDASTRRRHTDEAKEKMSRISKEKGFKPTQRPGFQKELDARIKMSCGHRGISIEEWDGFTTPENDSKRGEFKRTGLSKACFERDDFTCCRCGERGGKLNAHHANSWKWFPEQRFDIGNMVTLCHHCHKAFHSIYGNGIKTPNTREQLDEWLLSSDLAHLKEQT